MSATRLLVRSITVALAFAATAARAQDLSSLPEYRPHGQVSGVLRTRGSDQMVSLMRRWEEGFRKLHPRIAFDDTLRGDASAMIGLEESIADMVVMTRQIVPYDTYGVWRRAHRMPVEIIVATGSLDVPRKAGALKVFVHKDNPVSRLTVQQLDGIFGAQRTGGWKGMEWEPAVARDEKADIRTWGELGAGGEWADKPINTYGPPATFPGGMSFFQIRVMGGADSRAEGFREFADPARMFAQMSADRYGIGYAAAAGSASDLKTVALADAFGRPYVAPTRESVRDATYPLARSVYVYLPPDAPSGDPLVPAIAPKVREFLRYVLSRQGQEEVVREGDFLPLTPARAREQLKKLN